MALQTIKGGAVMPPWISTVANGYGFDYGLLLDAASEKAGMVVTVPKAGNIRKIGFRTGTVTTGATMDVRIETMAADGTPSGTLWAANTNVSHVIADTDDNVWLTTAALTANATVALGDKIAVVISNPAASFGTLTIARFNGQLGAVPYTLLFTTSWGAKSQRAPVLALEYSDGSYEPIFGVPGAFESDDANLNYNVDTIAQDEVALKLQIPFSARLAGVWWQGSATAGADFDIVIYDSDGTTVLSSTSFDGDLGGTSTHPRYLALDTKVVLAINTNYYVTLKPTTTANVGLRYVDFDVAALLDTMDGGQNWRWSSRVGAGAWTDIATRRPLMGLLLDQL